MILKCVVLYAECTSPCSECVDDATTCTSCISGHTFDGTDTCNG